MENGGLVRTERFRVNSNFHIMEKLRRDNMHLSDRKNSFSTENFESVEKQSCRMKNA